MAPTASNLDSRSNFLLAQIWLILLGMGRISLAFVILSLSVFGCGDGSSSGPDARLTMPPDAAYPDADLGPPTEFGGARPATLLVPTNYATDTAMPLVIALHGRFTNPEYVISLFGISTWYEEKGFLFIAPDGLIDAESEYVWNATDACCDLYDTGTDDVAYLRALITDISAAYNVDAKQIYIIGHSNGGFMAYRMACEHADVIAAVISIAGATYKTPSDCSPTEAVSVAQLHGTADTSILYDGGMITKKDVSETMVAYPGALESVSIWAAYNGCDAATQAGTNLDLAGSAGDETEVTTHTGCPAGVNAELWTMPGLGHAGGVSAEARHYFWTWLQAHAK